MLETIVLIILLISILGISLIIFKKIPVLANFSLENVDSKGIFRKLREEIKNNIVPKTASSSQTVLLKILSKARVLFLKGEHKIAVWLSILRQKSAKRKKMSFSDGYWDKLKIKKRGRKPKIEE